MRRLDTILCSLLLVAGCATTPPVDKVMPGVAEVALPPTANSITSPSSHPQPIAAADTQKPPPGYKARVRKGETFYCRIEDVTGSRFGKEVCWTPEDLEQMLKTNKTEVGDLYRRNTACGLEGCDSSH